jgi:hypothetical protein
MPSLANLVKMRFMERLHIYKWMILQIISEN